MGGLDALAGISCRGGTALVLSRPGGDNDWGPGPSVVEGVIVGIDDILRPKRQAILRAASERGARRIRVFGSVARGEADEDSDIDFLVDMEPGRSGFDLSGLLADLQDLLGPKVDIVAEGGLHWYIRDRILQEAKAL